MSTKFIENILAVSMIKNKFQRGVIGVAIILGSLFFVLAFIGLLYYSINFRVRRLVEESLTREKAKLNIVSISEAYFKPVVGDADAINVTVKSPMRLRIVFIFLYYNGNVELRRVNYIVEGISYFIVDDINVCSGNERYQMSVKLVTAEGAIIPAPIWVIK